jgi:hypothetical protein
MLKLKKIEQHFINTFFIFRETDFRLKIKVIKLGRKDQKTQIPNKNSDLLTQPFKGF